jgi:hypothetical protein
VKVFGEETSPAGIGGVGRGGEDHDVAVGVGECCQLCFRECCLCTAGTPAFWCVCVCELQIL